MTMKKHFILLIFSILSGVSFAQTDSLPSPKPPAKPVAIAEARRALLASFLENDPAGTGLWMDSLSRLENELFAGLIWDERWLLYYWTESYGTLLEEVSVFDENQRALQSWKTQPAADSLFEWVDYTLNERRFEIFSSIRSAFLNEEEKVFTTLLLEYLLRLNHEEEEWAERLQSFEKLYPSSRFLAFVRSIKPKILKPSNSAISFSGGLLVGSWNGDIERSLATPYAFHLDAAFWKKRWNWSLDFAVGGPKITRDLVQSGEVWPEKDPTNFLLVGINAGYDIVNSSKIRIYPSVGGGFGLLRPPTPGEDEDPLPDYYRNFNFSEFHLSAAITTDIKLFSKNHRDWDLPKGSYHGIRLKFGWNGLNFGQKNEALRGQMFYFAVHYNLFAVMSQH
jgi:hypothetical protein